MKLYLKDTKDLVERMKRIEGQARGIQRMIDEQQECEAIVIQLAAMKAALNKVAMVVIGCHMAEQLRGEEADQAAEDQAVDAAIRIFTKFS